MYQYLPREPGLVRRSMRTPQVDFVQSVSHHIAAVLRIAVDELVVQRFDPREERLLRGWKGIEIAIFVSRHSSSRSLKTNVQHSTATERVVRAQSAHAL